VKIIRLLIITLMLATTIVGYSRAPLWEPTQSASSGSLSELGVDDGFACVLFYGSDIDGNLETCG